MVPVPVHCLHLYFRRRDTEVNRIKMGVCHKGKRVERSSEQTEEKREGKGVNIKKESGPRRRY